MQEPTNGNEVIPTFRSEQEVGEAPQGSPP